MDNEIRITRSLDRSSMVGWRSITTTIVVASSTLVLGTVISADLVFGILLACVPCLLLPVQLGLRRYYRRRLRKLLGSPTSQVWEYSDQEWTDYCDSSARLLAVFPSAVHAKLIISSLGFGALAGGGLFAGLMTIESIEVYRSAIFCILFAATASLALLCVFVGRDLLDRSRIRRLRKSAGWAILGEDGFSFRHWIVLWNSASVKLTGAAIIRNDHSQDELSLKVFTRQSNPISGIGTFSTSAVTDYRIPIPNGQASDAERYCKCLTSSQLDK